MAKRIRKSPTIKEVPTPERPRVKADPEHIYQQEVIKVNQVDPEPIYEEEQNVQEEPEENQDFIDDYIDADGDYGGESEDEEADEEDDNVEDANGDEEGRDMTNHFNSVARCELRKRCELGESRSPSTYAQGTYSS